MYFGGKDFHKWHSDLQRKAKSVACPEWTVQSKEPKLAVREARSPEPAKAKKAKKAKKEAKKAKQAKRAKKANKAKLAARPVEPAHHSSTSTAGPESSSDESLNCG